MNTEEKSIKTATLAGGCFWCVEAIYQQLKGVETVVSGYMGGHKANPTYEEVCSGSTGHAEVIQLSYDSSQVSFTQLLEVFFKTHDPTTLNRQGNDVGTQYRSAIFYHDLEQKSLAEKVIKNLEEEGVFNSSIVTTLEAATTFYPAEDYHQNYLNRVGDGNAYCSMVVRPKVEKFKKAFKEWLKE